MLNLLHANDQRGTYPKSWYAATTPLPKEPHPPLKGETHSDICVIGGGLTGLSAALHLEERGYDVVLLDAQRVAFGASGRNGGQLGTGQRRDQEELEELVGPEDARRMWQISEEAKALVKDLITRHEIACDLRPGVATLAYRRSEVEALHAHADHLDTRYGYHALSLLDAQSSHALCPSPRYVGGLLDQDAAHLNPLAFALGLAHTAERAGVRIFEGSEVHHITPGSTPVVHTGTGRVRCKWVLQATNGYLTGLSRDVTARVMPINNYIIATQPLGKDAARVLTEDVAVADTRFVVNYFRLTPDQRLLFGGGESYGYRFPNNIEAKVRRPMARVFPHLKNVKIDYAWGGTLAITRPRMPYFAKLSDNMLAVSGYSGHGVGMATQAGHLMARFIAGQAEGFDVMSRVPMPTFPGAGGLATPLLSLAMSWYALRDRLGI